MTRWRLRARAPAFFAFAALSLAAYVACGGDDANNTPETGGLGQTCSGGDVCNPGLECKSGVCATKSDATTPAQDGAAADATTDAACSPDLKADPKNCGRCGHVCFGGASCRLGTCEASPLVDPIAGPTAIATDGTSIFWAERGMPVTATGASVKKCALGGCSGQPQVVASGLPEIPALAVTASAAYFMARDVPPAPHVLYRCPTAGCGVDAGVLESLPFGENAGLSLAIQGTSLLYPIERGTTEDAGVVRLCTTSTCPPPIDLVGGLDAPKHVVVTTDKIFVVDQTGIRVCPAAGCPVSPPIFTPLTTAVLRVAASDTDLMWLDAKGDISSCPLAGCNGAPKKVLVRGRDQGQSAFFLGMLDGTLYFAETDQLNGPRWLRACKPEQCTATLKNVVSLAGARPSFALANKVFYFTSDIAVLRWAP